MNVDTRYINQVQAIISIFTMMNGKLKILLFRREEEPFKGYWMLPSNLVMVNETLEECAQATIDEYAGLTNLYIEQCHFFSEPDRLPSDRIMAASYIALIDSISVQFKRNTREGYSEWFPIDEIPKTVYDYGVIIESAIEYLRKRMLNTTVLKHLFPSDFTLPELQMLYEQVLNKELDRRNFRKKFMNLELLEPTGDQTGGGNGRPAKLYRFKENIGEKTLF